MSNFTSMKMAGLMRAYRKIAKPLFLAVLLGVATLVAAPTLYGLHAQTADLANPNSKFVRLGINKSMVVRLPGAARDVIVGNPGIVDAVVRSQNRAYLFGRQLGQSNVYFFDADGRQILSLEIEVARDPLALQRLIERAIPGTRITVDTMNENVVLGGVAANPAEAARAQDIAVQVVGDAKKVLSTIAVTGKDQVMLKVRVAEMQRSVLKQLGVDLEAVFSVGNFTADLLNVNPFTLSTVGSLNASSQVLNYQNGNTDISGQLTALERDGILRTLAEPTLTAISGESAKFLAGGEFPVPVGTDDNEVTIEFKPFGVGLGFTPVVLSEGRISLRINTEVSELSNENAITVTGGSSSSSITIPALKVRRAETTVELPSGGSMIMAGLIQDVTKQEINGIPGLKNVPVLGTLFRSRDFQANQTELVVIVTPYTVSPVNERQLATPMDRFNAPTDRQTILFGRLNKVYGTAGQGPKGVYHGNIGYIVE